MDEHLFWLPTVDDIIRDEDSAVIHLDALMLLHGGTQTDLAPLKVNRCQATAYVDRMSKKTRVARLVADLHCVL